MIKMERNSRLKSKETKSNKVNTSPIRTCQSTDYSPSFIPCTQETNDTVDVLWDWNSPDGKAHFKKKRPKRILATIKSSPKLILKKTYNQETTSFDNIKRELRAFQEEINIAQSASLPLNDFYDDKNSLNDLFNDSLDDDLILISQQVEEKIKHDKQVMPNTSTVEVRNQSNLSTPKVKKKYSPRTITKSLSSTVIERSPQNASSIRNKIESLKMDDSLDAIFESLDQEILLHAETNKQVGKQSSPDIYAAGSANNIPSNNCTQSEDVLKFKRKSLSFGDSFLKQTADERMRQEIEQKRLAALEKLKAHKRISPSGSNCSPQCSPEEIEKKRQQALAIQMKKKQDMIERNRQEALKRLEMNRRRRHQ